MTQAVVPLSRGEEVEFRSRHTGEVGEQATSKNNDKR